MADTPPEALAGQTFTHRTLRASRFVECDLGEVVVRGSEVAGMEIDSPWLLEDGSRLLVNGVDVVPLVDAELSRRFPCREYPRDRPVESAARYNTDRSVVPPANRSPDG